MLTTEQVAALYVSVFGRAPELSGLQYWSTQFTGSFEQAVQGFVRHPLFELQYGSLSNQAKVESFYKQVLGGYGDPAGVAYWTQHLDAGQSVASVLSAFIMQSLAGDFSADSAAQARQSTFKNKIEVALFYTQTFAAKSEFHPASDTGSMHIHADLAYQQALRAIAPVDYSAQSVELAKQAILDAFQALTGDLDGLVTPQPDGVDSNTNTPPVLSPTFIVLPGDSAGDTSTAVDPFSLTVGLDQLQGDAADNVFKAPIITMPQTGVQLATLGLGDQVHGGGGGHNTLHAMLLGGNMSTVVKPLLQQIQTVHVQSLANSTLDLSASTGVELVVINGRLANTNILGLQQAAVQLDHFSGAAAVLLAGIDGPSFSLALNQVGSLNSPLKLSLDAVSDMTTVQVQALTGSNHVALLAQSASVLKALDTVVLQAAAGSDVMLDAQQVVGSVSNALTIQLGGAGQVEYKGDKQGVVAETFVLLDSISGTVTIHDFKVQPSALTDRLDLSALGVTGWDALDVLQENGSTRIIFNDENLDAQIILLGVTDITENDLIFI